MTYSAACTVQYSTVQYSTVQYSTVQHSTVQYSTVQYSTHLCTNNTQNNTINNVTGPCPVFASYTLAFALQHLGFYFIYKLISVLLRVFEVTINVYGARGGVVVKALHYKTAGHGFDSRWCHWNFSVT